jgi:hypothetical protein
VARTAVKAGGVNAGNADIANTADNRIGDE